MRYACRVTTNSDIQVCPTALSRKKHFNCSTMTQYIIISIIIIVTAPFLLLSMTTFIASLIGINSIGMIESKSRDELILIEGDGTFFLKGEREEMRVFRSFAQRITGEGREYSRVLAYPLLAR